nr:type IV secretion system DNA-binding domain-containing protein [Candidatus Curtissbacteria bacterium]
GLLAFTAIAVAFLLTLSASMAVMAERLRDHGFTEWEIFKAKSWRIVGLLPFILIIAFIAADYIPQNITIKNFVKVARGKDHPETEKDYRELVEDAKSKLESTESDLRMEKYSLESSADDNARLVREHKRAKTVEEKSEIEERNNRVVDDYNKSEANIAKYTKEIPELKKKLELRREDLDAFRNGQRTSFDKTLNEVLATAETTNTNKEKFMLFGILFLIGSLIVSYPMIYAIRSDKRELKIFNKVVRFLDVVFEKVSEWGQVPFRFIINLFYKGKEKQLNPSMVMQLGLERNSYLTDSNLNYHTQIIGGSGAGKTNLLKVMLEDRMAKGHSIIFFDFKADVELMDWMAGASEQYGRSDDLVILSMSDPKLSYAYNPIKHGSETEISSQIMNSLTWSEPFYKSKSEGALLVILKALCYQRDMGGRDFHLGDLYQFLNDASFRMDIVSAVSSLNYPEMHRGDLKRICEELTIPNKKENFNSLITQISKILNSSAGDIVVHKIGNDEEFEFREVMETGKVAYLFMNSLKLKDTASIMGKLMLQDLMKAVGNIYDDRNAIKHPTTLIIDEFASFATPDFGEFIEKARGAGISIVIAYQSRKSLDHIEDNLAIKVNENTANKIVFQVQDSEDVEWFCSLLGTKKTTKETYQAEDGIFGDTKTGMKSVREVEEYVIHPNQIKNLKLGQALLYCSKVDRHHAIMNIKKANPFIGRYERKSVPSKNLGKVNVIKIDQIKENETEVNNYF